MTTATPGLDGTFLTDDHDRTQWVVNLHVNRLLDEGW
jgi:hypothetical protein